MVVATRAWCPFRLKSHAESNETIVRSLRPTVPELEITSRLTDIKDHEVSASKKPTGYQLDAHASTPRSKADTAAPVCGSEWLCVCVCVCLSASNSGRVGGSDLKKVSLDSACDSSLNGHQARVATRVVCELLDCCQGLGMDLELG